MFLESLFYAPVSFFSSVLIVIFSISLHELAHGFAALQQGDNTPRKAGHLTLNPLVHMGVESVIALCITGFAWGYMPVNPHKFRSKRLGIALVAIAGPLCNLFLGLLFIALLKFMPEPVSGGILEASFCYLVAQINLSLFFLNLLPFPPLDGFHIFSEIFPQFKILNDNPIGLFPLVVLLLNPDYSAGLNAVVDYAIAILSGVQLIGL
jgi:Zn-dependent protease